MNLKLDVRVFYTSQNSSHQLFKMLLNKVLLSNACDIKNC